MRTTRVLLTSLIMTAVLSLGATRTTGTVETKNTGESTRCVVTLAQMQDYLGSCSHHHTVYWIQYIPGSCDGLAGIEGGQTATVHVENGIIINHQDSN